MTSPAPASCTTYLERRISSFDFRDAYDDHVDRIYGFFAYRLRDVTEVEDLTQQTFERALRAWGRYDPDRASVGTWLLVIARNLLIDHMRAGHVVRERSLDELTGGDAELAAVQDRHDLGLAPDLEQALAKLDDRQRELIALRFGGDLSCPEIAELTGLTRANVQQILSRALRSMRTSLERERAPAARAR